MKIVKNTHPISKFELDTIINIPGMGHVLIVDYQSCEKESCFSIETCRYKYKILILLRYLRVCPKAICPLAHFSEIKTVKEQLTEGDKEYLEGIRNGIIEVMEWR